MWYLVCHIALFSTKSTMGIANQSADSKERRRLPAWRRRHAGMQLRCVVPVRNALLYWDIFTMSEGSIARWVILVNLWHQSRRRRLVRIRRCWASSLIQFNRRRLDEGAGYMSIFASSKAGRVAGEKLICHTGWTLFICRNEANAWRMTGLFTWQQNGSIVSHYLRRSACWENNTMCKYNC